MCRFGEDKVGGAMKVFRIGIDAIEIERISRALRRRREPFLRRVLTEAEVRYCLRYAEPESHVAARFAAKEACAKALGDVLPRGWSWHEVAVARHPSGQPRLLLSGEMLAAFERLGASDSTLSLTHCRTIAMAAVVLWG